MARFAFRAVDRVGAVQAGELEATAVAEAVLELERRGLTPLRVILARGGLLWRLRRTAGQRAVSFRNLVDLTQELAALLRAGLTIDRGLAIAASLNEQPAVRALLSRLLERVQHGRSFADALAVEQGLPGYYSSMMRAGELGGALPEVMARTGQFMGRAQDMKERVQSALIYPAILLAMIGLTLLLVLFVVLPRFERLFAEAGAKLPLPTRIVLGLGHLVTGYGAWLVVLVIGAAVLAAAQWRKPGVRRRVHGWILNLRGIGPLLRAIDTARFLRTLATLLANGATLPAGIRVARGALTNLALVAATDTLLKRLREGESLADRLAHAQLYPRIAVQLARVGEETGHLDQMLAQAADVLDRQAQQTLERGLAVLVPLVTIAMGLIVAALIASVLVGILSLNDLAF